MGKKIAYCHNTILILHFRMYINFDNWFESMQTIQKALGKLKTQHACCAVAQKQH